MHPDAAQSATKKPLIDLDKTWVDLRKLGGFGRILGAIVCAIVGMILGALGAIVWIGVLYLVGSAIGGLDQLESVSRASGAIFSGGLFAGVLGIVPGTILGFGIGITNSRRLFAAAVLSAFGIGYCLELGYGYPVSVVGVLFYAGAPVLAVWFAGLGVLLLKIKLGLMRIEQILPALKVKGGK